MGAFAPFSYIVYNSFLHGHRLEQQTGKTGFYPDPGERRGRARGLKSRSRCRCSERGDDSGHG